MAYAVALVGWSAVFTAWTAGVLAIDGAVVGYGWLAIAAYGGALTVALVSIHRAEVLAALGLETPDAVRV